MLELYFINQDSFLFSAAFMIHKKIHFELSAILISLYKIILTFLKAKSSHRFIETVCRCCYYTDLIEVIKLKKIQALKYEINLLYQQVEQTFHDAVLTNSSSHDCYSHHLNDKTSLFSLLSSFFHAKLNFKMNFRTKLFWFLKKNCYVLFLYNRFFISIYKIFFSNLIMKLQWYAVDSEALAVLFILFYIQQQIVSDFHKYLFLYFSKHVYYSLISRFDAENSKMNSRTELFWFLKKNCCVLFLYNEFFMSIYKIFFSDLIMKLQWYAVDLEAFTALFILFYIQ